MFGLPLIQVIAFLIGVVITPWVSSIFVFNLLALLKKFYVNDELQNEQILFNCWSHSKPQQFLYMLFVFIAIICSEIAYFYQHTQFYFFVGFSILFIFIFCWNSLIRIEITDQHLSIYKLIFGTDTEIHSLKLVDIYSVHKRIHLGMMSNFFSSENSSQLIIKTKKGQEIIVPAPSPEDLSLLLSFLDTQGVLIQSHH